MSEKLYYNHERRELLRYISPGLRAVLDIGCGAGNFGQILKREFNCSVWGIEPSKKESDLAKAKLDHVINDYFSGGIDFNGQEFNAIFFNDVLEHIQEPKDALVFAKEHLAVDGYVYASIPNFLFFNNIYPMIKSRDWRYEDAGILDRTHVRFFTRKSMVRLFEEAGYRVEEIHGINPTWTKKFLFLCRLFPGTLNDFKFLQFFIKACPVDKR